MLQDLIDLAKILLGLIILKLTNLGKELLQSFGLKIDLAISQAFVYKVYKNATNE